MPLKKEKEKILGETFDDERVRSFLKPCSIPGYNDDYVLLQRAYRGMKAENFATFIGFFNEAGHDINALNPDGLSLLQVAKSHGNSEEYCAALISGGARD